MNDEIFEFLKGKKIFRPGIFLCDSILVLRVSHEQDSVMIIPYSQKNDQGQFSHASINVILYAIQNNQENEKLYAELRDMFPEFCISS